MGILKELESLREGDIQNVKYLDAFFTVLREKIHEEIWDSYHEEIADCNTYHDYQRKYAIEASMEQEVEAKLRELMSSLAEKVWALLGKTNEQ